jgi:hypothetical protein
MHATRLQMIALTAGAVLVGLSRIGGLPADISIIAFDPVALMQPVIGPGTTKFQGAPARPM